MTERSILKTVITTELIMAIEEDYGLGLDLCKPTPRLTEWLDKVVELIMEKHE